MRYEIRAMSFGEILDAGFQLLRNHFQLLVGISLVLYLPIGLLNIVLERVSTQGESAGESAGTVLVTILPLALAVIVAGPIVGAAITYALGHLYLGEQVEFGDAMRAAFGLLVPLMGTSILAYLFVFIGLVLLIIPGIYLAFAFFLIGQVIVLERVFGLDAMRRSHELMKGNKGRAFGIFLIGSIIVAVLTTGLQLVLSFVPYLGTLASSVAQAIGGVYMSAISIVLYFDIRCRKEAFDLEHLAQLVQSRGPGAAQAGPLVR